MPAKNYTNEEIVRYLFAEMPEAECEALEDAIFENADLFAMVAEVENDWIDNYVRDLLPLRERQRFERNYLTHSTRLRRVQNARAMLTQFDQIATTRMTTHREVEKASWWKRFLANLGSQRLSFALPAALAILLVVPGSLWTWTEVRQLRRQVADLQAAQLIAEQRIREARQQGTKDSSPAPVNFPPTPTPTTTNASSTIATLFLTSDVLRSTEIGPTPQSPLLTITPNVQQVRLILKNPATDYSSYQAELQNASGETVLSLPRLSHQKTPAASTFSVTLPANKLSPGDYFLVIKGLTNQGETDRFGNAQFRVEKK